MKNSESEHSCNNCHEIKINAAPPKGREKQLIQDLISCMPNSMTIVDKIVPGPKFMAVIAGGRMGISATLGAVPDKNDLALFKSAPGKTLKTVAEYAYMPSPGATALGIAAINAGFSPDPARVEPCDFPADDLIAELGKDKNTGLVGNFPFVNRLADRVGRLHLFELRDVPGAVPRDQWEKTLGELDVLALTATTLLTRQAAWYLDRANQAQIIILGPTTPAAPVLFQYGADYLCGSVVTDIDKVAEGIKTGLPFSQVKRNGGIIFTRWQKKDISDMRN